MGRSAANGQRLLELLEGNPVVVQGGAASVHVSDSHDIQEGMQLTVESQEHATESVSADEYGKPVGHANVDLPNGTYNGTLVVDEAGRRSASVITREQYETLKKKYGSVSSWAVWEAPDEGAKSNIGIAPDFDAPEMLEVLGTGYVFVDLNASSAHGEPGCHSSRWGNFHSGYRHGNDFKLRFALMGSRFWGSYLTDAIKDYPEVDSGKALEVLKAHPEMVERNISCLREELGVLGEVRALIAMGGGAYDILSKTLRGEWPIARIDHFSSWCSKERYRERTLAVIDGL